MERLGIIAVSVREQRRGFAFAQWIHTLSAARANADLIDLRDWPKVLAPSTPRDLVRVKLR